MTAPAPSTTQMTPPCYQLNFAGIFFFNIFFFSHQIAKVFFSCKSADFSTVYLKEKQMYQTNTGKQTRSKGSSSNPPAGQMKRLRDTGLKKCPYVPVSPWGSRAHRQGWCITTADNCGCPIKAQGLYFPSLINTSNQRYIFWQQHCCCLVITLNIIYPLAQLGLPRET